METMIHGAIERETMEIQKFLREVVTTSYYRRRPVAALRFAYAKWVFSRFRVDDPLAFLTALDIDINTAMEGFHTWRPTLERMVSAVQEHHGQQGGISMEDGIVLYGLTRAVNPDFVIETGVAAGVSTSFICAALIENGHGVLYSIELPAEESASRVHPDGAVFDWPKHGVGWAIPEEVKQTIGGRHILILQDVRVALPSLLERLPYVDIFFHDDLHTPNHMLWEFDVVWPHLRSTGLVISDDVNFGWIQFSRKYGFGKNALNNIQRLSVIRKP